MPDRIRARVAVRRPVDYRDARSHGEGILLDLSLYGCRIQGAPPFACGTRLRLQLWLPGEFQPVKVEQAIVRWVKHDQCGVSFLEVHPDARARLERVFQVLHEAQHPVTTIE